MCDESERVSMRRASMKRVSIGSNFSYMVDGLSLMLYGYGASLQTFIDTHGLLPLHMSHTYFKEG